MSNVEISGEELLPHREPFLFLDRLCSHTANSSVGIVTFAPTCDFFRGHFPSFPVVPGVIVLEAMCQSAAAGALAEQREGQYADKSDILLFAGADKVRFRRPIRPGESLETHSETLRVGHGIGKFRTRGYVNGELAAEAEIFCVARKGASR